MTSVSTKRKLSDAGASSAPAPPEKKAKKQSKCAGCGDFHDKLKWLTLCKVCDEYLPLDDWHTVEDGTAGDEVCDACQIKIGALGAAEFSILICEPCWSKVKKEFLPGLPDFNPPPPASTLKITIQGDGTRILKSGKTLQVKKKPAEAEAKAKSGARCSFCEEPAKDDPIVYTTSSGKYSACRACTDDALDHYAEHFDHLHA
jgi:hypothetical protein